MLADGRIRAVEAQRSDAERRATRAAEEAAQLRGTVRELEQDIADGEQARARSTQHAVKAARGDALALLPLSSSTVG